MKTTIFFCFLSCALLSSCSTSYDYHSAKINVSKTYNEGQGHEYELLSVRGDSAIVVLDWSEKDISPVPFSHAEVLNRYPYLEIIRNGHGGGGPAGSGALAGAILGGLFAGFFLMPSQHSQSSFGTSSSNRNGGLPQSTNNNLDFSGLSGLADLAQELVVLGIIAGGTIIGATIANFLPPSTEFSLNSPKDRALLRSISAYPDKEPDEMKYIK